MGDRLTMEIPKDHVTLTSSQPQEPSKEQSKLYMAPIKLNPQLMEELKKLEGKSKEMLKISWKWISNIKTYLL